MRFTHRRRDAAEAEGAYVSDFTRFMEAYMNAHPEERREQREGWNIYWDKQVNQRALEAHEKSTVPTPGYYYFDSPETHRH